MPLIYYNGKAIGACMQETCQKKQKYSCRSLVSWNYFTILYVAIPHFASYLYILKNIRKSPTQLILSPCRSLYNSGCVVPVSPLALPVHRIGSEGSATCTVPALPECRLFPRVFMGRFSLTSYVGAASDRGAHLRHIGP